MFLHMVQDLGLACVKASLVSSFGRTIRSKFPAEATGYNMDEIRAHVLVHLRCLSQASSAASRILPPPSPSASPILPPPSPSASPISPPPLSPSASLISPPPSPSSSSDVAVPPHPPHRRLRDQHLEASAESLFFLVLFNSFLLSPLHFSDVLRFDRVYGC